MKPISLILTLGLAMPSAFAVRVTVQYEAEAGTVTGTPFGMTVPRLTIVRGYLSYETNVTDSQPTDPMRGNFVLNNNWDFRAEFLGRVVKGSGSATASTNLFGSPTLRFEDGRINAQPPLMSIDAVPDAAIGLGFAISGQAKDLPTDQLPENFTFNPPPSGASHTFVLSTDTGVAATTGSMLLQFRSFSQVPLAIKSIQELGTSMEVTWYSVGGKPYALDFSTDMSHWTIIRDGLIGAPTTTTVLDDLALRYPTGPRPTRGYYRMIDRGPL